MTTRRSKKAPPKEELSTLEGLPVRLIPAISPENGAHFSENLYKWVRRNARTYCPFVVYADGSKDLWVGYIFDGDFIGARLNSILCLGVKATVGCWTGLAQKLRPKKLFWQKYLKKGRCSIDPHHTKDFQDRFEVIGDKKHPTRRCKWCGALQYLVKKIVIRRREVEEWVNVQ